MRSRHCHGPRRRFPAPFSRTARCQPIPFRRLWVRTKVPAAAYRTASPDNAASDSVQERGPVSLCALHQLRHTAGAASRRPNQESAGGSHRMAMAVDPHCHNRSHWTGIPAVDPQCSHRPPVVSPEHRSHDVPTLHRMGHPVRNVRPCSAAFGKFSVAFILLPSAHE